MTPPRPTDAELEILNVIWRRGPSTVRDVHEEIVKTKPAAITTVLKFVQIMEEKGLLVRAEESRPQKFLAAVPPEATRGQLVRDLMDRAFAGSATSLMMHALSTNRATPAELEEMRRLLDVAAQKTNTRK